MFGYRNEIAAHQAAGGLLGIGEGGLDRDPVFHLDFGQDRALVRLVQILDQLDGIVGFQLLDDLRDAGGGQRLHHLFAHVVVEFGNHVRRHQIGNRPDQLIAFVALQQFEKVGDIGRVQRLYQFVDARRIAFIQRILDAGNIFLLERVLLVHPLVIDTVVRARLFLRLAGQQDSVIIEGAIALAHGNAV